LIRLVKIRTNIKNLSGYVPGKQPLDGDWLKLNTNESPESSPAALRAIDDINEEWLRRYPDPSSDRLRTLLAKQFHLGTDQVIVGNGADDIINLLIRATCNLGDRIVTTSPAYALYSILAEIQGATVSAIPLRPNFDLPVNKLVAAGGSIQFITSPNNPAGTAYPPAHLANIAAGGTNLVAIDEAYAEFADTNCIELLRQFHNVCIIRTFSKAYGLAGLRVGYLLGPPDLVKALSNIKDSYNVNRIAQIAAEAALNDTDWAHSMWARVRKLRDWLGIELGKLGLYVHPSQANFVLVDFGNISAIEVQRRLEERKILVRHLGGAQETQNSLRITIGTKAEMKRLVHAIEECL
jgi:histidinol-phosphate aminotransferase